MTGINQALFVDTVTSASPEDVDVGFKPRVMFCMGAGVATANLGTLLSNGYAGFGWSEEPGVGQATSAGSGGYQPGNVPAGCNIAPDVWTAMFSNTDLHNSKLILDTFNCDTAPGHATSGWSWSKAADYFDQVIPRLVLGGDGISVATGYFAWPGAAGDVAVTGVGFVPQLVMFLWAKSDSYNKSYPAGVGSGFGFGAASSPSDQYCHYESSIAFGPHWGYAIHNTGAVITHVDYTGPMTSGVLASMDSDGFTVTFDGDDTGEFGSDSARVIGWIALRDAAGGFHVGTETAPGSTGSVGYSGCGFTPDQVIVSHGNVPSVNTWYDVRGQFGFGICDDTLQAGFVSGETLVDAGISGMISGRRMDDDKVLLFRDAFNDSPTVLAASATRTSIDSDGFTLDWDDADGNAWPFGWIAMKTTGGNFGGTCGPTPAIVSFSGVEFPK